MSAGMKTQVIAAGFWTVDENEALGGGPDLVTLTMKEGWSYLMGPGKEVEIIITNKSSQHLSQYTSYRCLSM
jgi:hypothetical protein